MDAKDILGLPKTPSKQEKKPQPKKESHRKPDGVSREVYALTGGLGSLTTSIEANKLKKQQQSDEKITWQWLPFTNSARKDNLQLYHWVKVVNGVPPTGDYLFAKYNKSVDVVKYTDEEYDKYLTDPKWTKQETDQLFDLCQRFDLRFVVIADRFPTSRTVEELKDRFYSVSRAILVARAPSPRDVAGHPLIKEPYDVSQEIERKRALSSVLSRKKQQERKDAEVLEKAKGIIQLLIAARKMVQAASQTPGVWKVKCVDPTLQELGVLKPRVPTKADCAWHLESRIEILTPLNLQKQPKSVQLVIRIILLFQILQVLEGKDMDEGSKPPRKLLK